MRHSGATIAVASSRRPDSSMARARASLPAGVRGGSAAKRAATTSAGRVVGVEMRLLDGADPVAARPMRMGGGESGEALVVGPRREPQRQPVEGGAFGRVRRLGGERVAAGEIALAIKDGGRGERRPVEARRGGLRRRRRRGRRGRRRGQRRSAPTAAGWAEALGVAAGAMAPTGARSSSGDASASGARRRNCRRGDPARGDARQRPTQARVSAATRRRAHGQPGIGAGPQSGRRAARSALPPRRRKRKRNHGECLARQHARALLSNR